MRDTNNLRTVNDSCVCETVRCGGKMVINKEKYDLPFRFQEDFLALGVWKCERKTYALAGKILLMPFEVRRPKGIE